MENSNILRGLPKIDILLQAVKACKWANDFSYQTILDASRQTLEDLRTQIVDKKITEIPHFDKITESVWAYSKKISQYNLRPVINATGVVLHTNLGRAVLAKSVCDHVAKTASSYCTLEYDLASGERGSRHTHIESLICALTGAEAAMVVNNNAAAVMLALMSLAQNKEVIVSRGELVEIGGSFRVPKIMELSGCILKEIGTTNKTRLDDYQSAISPQTAALLKVHTSNFKIVGFCQSVDIQPLGMLAKENGIPLIYDLGSGLLFDSTHAGLCQETSVCSAIKDGADIVCFSGDKLLGGPQAGIIAGKKKLISLMKSNQLARVVRIDKLSLSALEATLRIYLDKDAYQEQIPVLGNITASESMLCSKAKKLLRILKSNCKDYKINIISTEGQVGGGSAPGALIKSCAVEIFCNNKSAQEIEKQLREFDTPIIVRINKNKVLMDVRTIEENDFKTIANALNNGQQSMKNNKLSLRNLEKDDSEFILKNWVGHSTIFSDDIKKEELVGLIELWNTKKHNDEYFEMFGIASHDVLVGVFSLYQKKMHIKEQAVSIGIEIDRFNRRKGIATDAIALILQLARQKDFKIIYSQARQDNIASINLHKKCGFKITDSALDKSGNKVNNYKLYL